MGTSATTESATATSVGARALRLASTALEFGEKALHAKCAVEHAVDDGVRAAQHTFHQGRHTAEDLVDQTTSRIRRKPLQTVGWALACGALCGATALYAIRRMWRG
jgi:ElaB/YqjD/DUF883 family membrane-anchored ribosome-binding protein